MNSDKNSDIIPETRTYSKHFKMLQRLLTPHVIILFISSGGIAFAYLVEYIMYIPPCPLCIYQRFPYLILIFLSIISIPSEQKLIPSYVVTFLLSIALASYHTGVERGLFEMSSFCRPLVNINSNISASDFVQMLYNSTETLAPCNKPGLVIFGLSMTEWNLIANLIFLTIFVKYHKR